MTCDITPFSPARASRVELEECHDVLQEILREDFPGRPVPSCAAYAEQLRMPAWLLGPQRFWVARAGGRIVGTATLTLPDRENDGLTILFVRVLRRWRRRGIGTALLRATLPASRAAGRGLVTGQGLRSGAAGETWAAALEFTKVQEFVLQTLIVPDVDPGLWDGPAPAGFRIERWAGSAPEPLVAAYARARTAITDAPAGSAFRFADWTVERVRQHEADIQGLGDEQWVVAAVEEETGVMAGLTEVVLSPAMPEIVHQMETAVLPGFRGRGLGRFIKAGMMRWMVAERPEVEAVLTNTAADNEHMIRVNHQVGYVTNVPVVDVEADLHRLEDQR
jgi:mycothiol synthase